MGENGAGKSTFMNILMGLLSPDAGEIRLDGELLPDEGVADRLRRGIVMIHQEMLLVPELTVAQNIFLGREATRGWGWLDERRVRRQAAELLDRMGVDLRPDTPVRHLRVAEKQLIEIARALSSDRYAGAGRVLIMDEPTSALSEREAATLFRLMRELKARGVAIIYISHKLDEIAQLADTITVLRDGRYVDTRPAADLTDSALIALMVGRQVDTLYPEPSSRNGEEVLSVRGLSRKGVFSDISFSVNEGEILGIGGLMGAGRTELARALFGLDPAHEGEIYVRGQPTTIHSPADALRQGIAYVSEDRKGWGFVPKLSVRENLTLASLAKWAKGTFVQMRREKESARRQMTALGVKASGPEQPVGQLSGGNQQKVVIGRMLLTEPSIIILDEPTRGVDVGAKAEIYALIRQLADRGLAVILISSEMPELLGMSDRIMVMAAGRQTALLRREEASQETVLRYAVMRDWGK